MYTRHNNVYFVFQICLCDMSSTISRSYIKGMIQVMENTFWSIHKIPKKTSSQIQKKAFWIKFIISCFYAYIALSIPLACFYNWYPKWHLSSNNMLHMCSRLLFMLAITGAHIISYLHLYITIYLALNLNVQMMILRSYFEFITNDIKRSVRPKEIIEFNHTKFRNPLLVGIKQHVLLKR